ncbi:MAG: DotU family type IV/VI secretion system protein, partial [Pseudomonadota bacterium]
RRRGYSGEDVELASFGVIAFLDESILNLRSPIFADWPRQPLQEERYGHHIAGEIFFQNLQKLLARSDSQELADLLDIYQICLLLGFAGRYSMGGRGDLRVFVQQTAEKIQRIRHPSLAISPESALPAESAPSLGHDPWVKPILFAAIACFLLVVSSFLVYEFLLQSGASDLRNAAPASQAKLPVNAHGAARIAGRGVIPTSNPAESTAAGESAVRVFLGRIHA